MFCARPRVMYCEFGGEPYELLPHSPECYVKKGKKNIGYFQGMTIQASSLHIEHFAVDSSVIRQGKGERILRGFAALVKAQAPAISQIHFDLGRASSGTDLAELARARQALFVRIGAVNIQCRKPNAHSIVVSAMWPRAHW